MFLNGRYVLSYIFSGHRFHRSMASFQSDDANDTECDSIADERNAVSGTDMLQVMGDVEGVQVRKADKQENKVPDIELLANFICHRFSCLWEQEVCKCKDQCKALTSILYISFLFLAEAISQSLPKAQHGDHGQTAYRCSCFQLLHLARKFRKVVDELHRCIMQKARRPKDVQSYIQSSEQAVHRIQG